MANYHKIYDDLLQRLAGGEFSAGSRMPTEETLSAHYGVSRTTVRYAMNLLVEKGVVRRRPNRGFFVAEGVIGAGMSGAVPYVCIRGFQDGILTRNTGDIWAAPLKAGVLMGGGIYGVRLFDELPSPLMPASNLMHNHSGVIIMGAGAETDYGKLFKGLSPDTPRILLNRPADPELNITSICIDQRIGAFRAAGCLLRMNHRRIAIDCAGDKTYPGRERMKGYCDAFAAAGRKVDETMFLEYSPDDLDWADHIREILRRKNRPTAMMLDNRGQVLHLLDVIKSEGLKVPEDLSLIIFDDSPELRNSRLEISVVAQPLHQLAMEGVRMIRHFIDGGEDRYESIMLKTDFIVRDSITCIGR